MAKAASPKGERVLTHVTFTDLRKAEEARARAARASARAAAAPSPTASENLPRRNVLPETLPKPTGATDGDLSRQLLRQAICALASPLDTQNDLRDKVRLATIALDGIAPRDELESMLAVQMVATHVAAMECLRRASLPNQMLKAHDHHLKHAAKLMAIYERQLTALDKHRGKGQQKITVEHVTVQAGGQAVVGSVETGSPRAVPGRVAAPAPALSALGESSEIKPVVDLSAKGIREPKALAAANAQKASGTGKRRPN